jgi:Na+/glutamate symporter
VKFLKLINKELNISYPLPNTVMKIGFKTIVTRSTFKRKKKIRTALIFFYTIPSVTGQDEPSEIFKTN